MSPKKPTKPKAPTTRAKAIPHPTPQPKAKKAATAPDTPVTKPAARKRAVKKPAPKPTAKKATPAKVRKPKAAPVPVAVDEDAQSDPMGEFLGLSVREVRFVEAYLASYNASQAYIEAGFTAKSPDVAKASASRLLTYVNVRIYLAQRIKEMIARSEEQQDGLMRTLTLQASADVRELVEHRRGACRYCHGKFHRWQYTAGEWDKIITDHAERQEKALAAEKPMPKEPDTKGGTGYTWASLPHPECHECAGLGEGKTIVHDTRHLSPAAAAIYAGVKEGKDGIEVKTLDKAKALDTLVKIAKLYEDSTNVNVTMDMSAMEAKFGAVMAKSADRMEQMRLDRVKAREERGD